MSEHDAGALVGGDEIKAFIDDVERLETEKAAIAETIKDHFAEMKARGFDTGALRVILKLRKQDHAERQERGAIVELYMQAIGMS